MRPITVLALVVAVVATACGGTGDVGLGPLAGGEGDVLSPCASPGDATATTLVAADGARPPLADMEAALADNPDAQFVIDDQVAGGATREDAVHAMYAQVVGDGLLEDARALPGFVEGAYARPETGEPFRLSFSGDVPDAFDPAEYELGSYGLEVTTGAVGFDDDAFARAFEVATDLGIRVLSGSGDETAGTGTIVVIDATPEQVAAWEEQVPNASTICMVRATPTVACDGAGAIDPSEELPDVPVDELERVDAGARDEVTAGYLGLTLDAARDRGDREGRTVRVVVEDGVELGGTADLDQHRVNLTVCQGVVQDAVMDLDG